MSKKTTRNKGGSQSPDQLMRSLAKTMEQCGSAEALNNNVIIPFIAALEDTCAARGYTLNIYGERSNIAFTSEADAPVIYELIEEYLDSTGDT